MLSLILSLWLFNQAHVSDEDRVPVRRLHLSARDGRSWNLAEADRREEAASLDALLGSIQAKLGPPAAATAATNHQVIECASCGAPVPPADAEEVKCRWYHYGHVGDLEDEEQQEQEEAYRARACKLGFASACKPRH